MKLFRVQIRMTKYLSRSIIGILLIANLAACGFYLAGSSSLPPQLSSIQLLSDTLDGKQKTLNQMETLQERGGSDILIS